MGAILPRVALRQCVHDLVASLAQALAVEAGLEQAVYVDPTCGGSDFLVSLVRGGDISATMMTAAHLDAASRQARRRLRVHGIYCERLAVDADGAWSVTCPAVHLTQYPSPGRPAMSTEEILSAVDNLVLQMDGSNRAVVIAPASVLCDRIRDARANKLRDVLVTSRVGAGDRAVAQGAGHHQPRQALALWVLGPAYGDVHPQDRWTMVADLTDAELCRAAIGDLVSDLIVAMAGWPMVRAHAFRFARPAWTRNLLATGGDLVARRPGARSPRVSGCETAVRILELTAALGDALAVGVEARDPVDGSLRPMTLGEAIAAGQVRLIAGNRLDREDLPGGTVRVIGPEGLTGATGPGVDRLVFSTKYPTGRYTEPGDVIFCTSPRPAALVDVEGGSVVVAPARTLRINNATPELLPEVLASDINATPASARAWKGWRIRQVPPTERVALANALAAIEHQHADALNRATLLAELKHLILRGVTTGSLALTPQSDPCTS